MQREAGNKDRAQAVNKRISTKRTACYSEKHLKLLTVSSRIDMTPSGAEDRIDSKWLAREIGPGGSGAITSRMAELIRGGALRPGSRLPTVKSFAQELGVGPGLVATAWASLRLSGLIETRRRGGTVVAGTAATGAAPAGTQSRPWAELDLVRGVADPALLPDLGEALQAGLRVSALHQPRRDRCIAALRQAAEPTWPFRPEDWLVVDGASEGLLLAVAAACRERRVLAIEEPVNARILFTLAPLGLELVPVACDAEGPRPDRLREALARRPAAFVLQARHHNPLGHGVTRRRCDALAKVLAGTDVVVVEEDFLGPLADAPLHSLARVLPQQSVFVRGYCTAYGIDLKTALVAGAARLLAQMDRERVHGAGSHSRILQGALAHLLQSPAAAAAVGRARAVYRERAARLREVLRERGFAVPDGDGLVLWIPVADEVPALVALAGLGITAGAGSQCHVEGAPRGHIRIAVTQLPDDPQRLAALADALARAQGPGRGEDYGY